MKIITARQPGQCPLCAKPYTAGSRLMLRPSLGWTHLSCTSPVLGAQPSGSTSRDHHRLILERSR